MQKSKIFLRRAIHATGIFCTCTAFFDLIGCPMSISGTSMLVCEFKIGNKVESIFVFSQL